MFSKIPERVRRVAATVCFCMILVAVTGVTQELFERKYSYIKYYDFYQQEQDFDVLFLGTSHVLNAVYPMDLWRDYGMVSYNMANHSENICTNYWQLRNALQYTKPKVVVIDLYAVDGDGKVNEQYLHNFLDEVPFSLLKIEMVRDLLEPEKRAEYLFNLSLYHSRWEELGKEDLRPVPGVEKGAEFRDDVTINVPPELIPKEDYDPTDRLNKQYLQKIIDLCKEQDIGIILMYVPYTMPEGHQRVANWGYVAAEKNDIPYLNFVYEDLEINYATDCADEAHHLNASGARKLTDYLGNYISTNYNVTDHREDPEYEFWYQDYAEYGEKKREWLNNQINAWSYLIQLNDRDYLTKIYAADSNYIYKDSEIKELLGNIGVYGKVEYAEPLSEARDDCFTVEVYKAEGNELISVRTFVRTEDGIYMAQQ
ncbi:MAG: hypothetical protein K2K74_19265 [Lachnospiraceae bacterium]|nr:hypothetical protein [Lachnospiraceae bacterium]